MVETIFSIVEVAMNRIFNFSAGPAQLPLEVLEEAREEMLDYRGNVRHGDEP